MNLSLDGFRTTIRDAGWFLAPAVHPAALVERLQRDLEFANSACHEFRVRNGVDRNSDGACHHVLAFGSSFLELLDTDPVVPCIQDFFGGKFILNSMGGAIVRRGSTSYLNGIHRDVRTFTHGFPLMLNVLVMLDEFTESNGATYLLSGSHRRAERPAEAEFQANAVQAVGPAGSVLLFDSNLWHAAGVNRTDRPRRALTLTFTRPFVKQQLDYPRLLGEERIATLSPRLRQLVGYNARVPANLDEWYQPREKRFYAADQE